MNIVLLAHETVMTTLRGWPTLVNVKPFTKPTLIVRGARSDYVLDSDVVALASLFPKTEKPITVANAGHWVHADAPTEFRDIVANFVDAKF